VAGYPPFGAWYEATYVLPAVRETGELSATVLQPGVVVAVKLALARTAPVDAHRVAEVTPVALLPW